MQAATALSIIEAFEAANIPHDKARAVVEALEKEMFEQLATKADLALIRTDLALLSRDLTIRLGVMMTVAVGVVATLVQLF